MAKLTIADASRVAGVARSTLYRAIQTGRLSADPDGHIDTAELLRAGYTLQRSAQQIKDVSLQDATPRNANAQQPSSPAATQAFHALQQERDMLRLERDLLRLVEQTQQRYDRLLDAPRSAPSPRPEPGPRPGPALRPEPRTAGPLEDTRGAMRRRIVALLHDHPEGLTPAEMRSLLGVDRSLADTCLGMLRYGLVQRVRRGRYVAAQPASMPPPSERNL
jgi:hypothetical protein